MAADSTLALSLVEEFVSGLQDSKAKDAAKGVKDGKFTVLQLVEALGSSLTSSQPHTRARGVLLLSEVLQECYRDLTEREVEVLIAFYENRLKDHYVVTPPVLKGLKELTKCTNLPPGSAVSMLRSVFQDIHVQVRLSYCCTFKGLGADFVFGFVQSMDGERDPRNLLLAFQIAKNLIHRGYELGKFTEELFEVTSCYFPIDFSPPPNDPHGITREELVQALRAVLTGTPNFAEFLLPLLIEKLDSDVQSAKLDSLQTLVRNSSLKMLCLVWPSAKLLQAACSASTSASHIITAAVMPSLLEQYNNRAQVIETADVHMFNWFNIGLFKYGVFLAFRESLCGVVFSALSENNSSLQITATSVLTSLAQQAGLLLESDIELALDHLTRLLLIEEDDRVSLAVAECAGALAQLHPALVISKLIPRLKNEMYTGKLLKISCILGTGTHTSMRQRCLSALAAVSIQPSVVQESTPVLLEVLRSAHTGNLAKKIFSVDEVVLTCRSLQRIAEQVQDTEEAGRCFHNIIIPHLLSLALQAALQGEKGSVKGLTSFILRHQNSFNLNLLSITYELTDFHPLSPEATEMYVEVCFDSVKYRLQVEVPQIDKLLSALEEMSCTCSHPLSYTSAAKCFAGLVNKKPQGDSLDSCACPQVSKALLLRYHPLFTTLTDKLFSLLDDAGLGPMAAADGFSLLMSDSTDVLNRACHADVRIMYRQRFFSENKAKLVQGFNAAPQEKKPNYLKALSNIVNKLPKQVQVTELPALLSLLLEALSGPDQDIHLTTLSCLEPVLVNPPQVLIQQLEALVNRLLALLCSPAMSVRIASLSCISALSYFPVLPFRARVLRALAKPLDDKKRLVRREAVQARAQWFLLGSPGGR
uniref:MMS19 nucleotide excision repair protein n=1 Tax=Astatotilapia calliptera TaxID=8154 RepID=A0AAX7U4Z5_ASTCA